MDKVIIEIETTNDAFADGREGAEVADILNQIAENFRTGGYLLKLRHADSSGNYCATVYIDETDGNTATIVSVGKPNECRDCGQVVKDPENELWGGLCNACR